MLAGQTLSQLFLSSAKYVIFRKLVQVLLGLSFHKGTWIPYLHLQTTLSTSCKQD